MLPMKKVDKLRSLYFDEGFTVTEICRKLHYSPTTVYRYIKMTDFNQYPKWKPRGDLKITPYLDDLKQWLEEDKNQHRKQRHTAKRAHERLKEMYPDYDVSYNCLNKHFQKLRKEIFKKKSQYLSLTHIPGEPRSISEVCHFMKTEPYIMDLCWYLCLFIATHPSASFTNPKMLNVCSKA